MAEELKTLSATSSIASNIGRAISGDQLKVNADGLRSVAQDMTAKKDEIMNIYNGTLKSIIESSKTCISTSGLDFEQVNSIFAKTFADLDSSITELSDALVNKIIPSYEDLSADIRVAFNSEFADQMSSILGM